MGQESDQYASKRDLAENTLCTIGNVIEDLSAFLNYWDNQTSFDATCSIVRLVNNNAQGLIRRNQLQGIWPKVQMSQVCNWITRPSIKQKLEDAFFVTKDENTANELSEAVQNLEWFQQMKCSS